MQKSWPIGRVTAVFPGPDSLVRAADITIGNKTLSINYWYSSESFRHLPFGKRMLRYLNTFLIDLELDSLFLLMDVFFIFKLYFISYFHWSSSMFVYHCLC